MGIGKLGIAVASLIAVAAVWLMLLAIGGLPDNGDEALALAIFGLMTGVMGTATGAGIFYAMSHALRSRALATGLSVLLSGLLSVAVGAGVGYLFVCPMWDSLIFGPHPDQYHGDIGYLFLIIYSAIATAIVGIVFGAGVGQQTASGQGNAA